MTLRNFLNRRIRHAAVWAILAFTLVWVLSARSFKGIPQHSFTGVAFVVAVFVFLFLSGRARCPKCGEAIGYIDTSEMRKHKKRILSSGLDRCRRCGLNLDEEIPATSTGPS